MGFDTHEWFKRLKAVGFTAEQAEVIVELQVEIINRVRTETGPCQATDTVSRADLREMEHRLIVKFGIMLVVAVGLAATVVKLVH